MELGGDFKSNPSSLGYRDGGFGVKDQTFQENKARYKKFTGMMAYVTMLSFTRNRLSAPIFESLEGKAKELPDPVLKSQSGI